MGREGILLFLDATGEIVAQTHLVAVLSVPSIRRPKVCKMVVARLGRPERLQVCGGKGCHHRCLSWVPGSPHEVDFLSLDLEDSGSSCRHHLNNRHNADRAFMNILIGRKVLPAERGRILEDIEIPVYDSVASANDILAQDGQRAFHPRRVGFKDSAGDAVNLWRAHYARELDGSLKQPQDQATRFLVGRRQPCVGRVKPTELECVCLDMSPC